MATEEFKEVTEELFTNYLELRRQMANKKFESVSLSFKEYLDFYIRYTEVSEPEDDEDEDYPEDAELQEYLDDDELEEPTK